MNESQKLSVLTKLSVLFVVLGISRFCAFNAKAKDCSEQPFKKKVSILYRKGAR